MTDEQLLAALRDFGTWVSADAVSRHLGYPVYERPSALAVGQKLSKLARRGLCKREFSGGSSIYWAV